MRRTDQEFKSEILRRKDKYLKERNARRKRILSASLSTATIFFVLGIIVLVSPKFDIKKNPRSAETPASGSTDTIPSKEPVASVTHNPPTKAPDDSFISNGAVTGETVSTPPAVGSGNDGYEFFQLSGDWPHYETAEEIVSVSDNIFEGTLKEINFAIVYGNIHTVYTVSVSKNFKGDTPDTFNILKPGGLKNYKLKEQYDLWVNSGVNNNSTAIPICGEDSEALEFNKTYLFCTSCAVDNNTSNIINPRQFAYAADSGEADDIRLALE